MKTKYHKKKGQAAMIDLFIAVFIFLILTAVIAMAWNLHVSRLNSNLAYNDAVVKALQITDVMVKTAGEPQDWNSGNVEVIGLAASDGTLSTAKVKNFTRMTPAEVRDKLRIQLYDFTFKIKKLDSSIVEEAGEVDPTKKEHTISVERIVIYNGEKAILEFNLQEK